MGTKFRYVSDDALDAAKAAINCEKCSSPEPAYIVEAVFQDGSDDPDELDFERALCVNCIRTIPLRNLIPIFPELQIQAAVNRHFPKGTLSGEARFKRAVDLCDEVRRTPKIFMFLQNHDWPTCCGDVTEYIGSEPKEGSDFAEYKCWNEDEFLAKFKLSDFYPLNEIEVLHSMALFKCVNCPDKYWVFQYSGLFWQGPKKN